MLKAKENVSYCYLSIYHPILLLCRVTWLKTQQLTACFHKEKSVLKTQTSDFHPNTRKKCSNKKSNTTKFSVIYLYWTVVIIRLILNVHPSVLCHTCIYLYPPTNQGSLSCRKQGQSIILLFNSANIYLKKKLPTVSKQQVRYFLL